MQTKKILTKLRLINWHYFNNETITLKNTNLFSGENGAGKSTILDAVQLILTTNSRRFNLAANTDSKRSLKSYVRGKTGEEGNEYLRKGAVISYIALEVYEETKQRYFVLGAKFESFDLESDVKKKWFCEEGTLDALSFITGNRPSKDEQFRNNGKKVNFIQQTSFAKDKFRTRLGHLQDNFFELLSKSLAFKPMKDIKSFVSQFILPERNVDIDTLSGTIRDMKEMQLVIAEVKKQVNDLEDIQNTYENILHIEEQILIIDILIKIAEAESNKADISRKTLEKDVAQQNISQNTKLEEELEQDINNLNDRYVNVRSALNSGKTAMIISSINNELSSKRRDCERLLEDIRKLKEQIKRIRSAIKCISAYSKLDFSKLVLLENNETDIQQRTIIITEIEAAFKEISNIIQNKLSDTLAEYNTLVKAIGQLEIEIKNLELNKLSYDKNVVKLKEIIEQEFTARGISSEVRILADMLEVSDIRWQNAVEGYLNTQRFHIIVEPQFYDIAAEVYNRNRSKIHTAAIVNTAKLDIKAVPDENSLASVVKSENVYARAYVCYLLGRVTMCETVQQLKEHRIAITKECMLYQGNTLRNINPEIYHMPYIGKYALVQQLKIKKAEYEEKNKRKNKLDLQKESFDSTTKAINNCNFEIIKDVLAAPVKHKMINAEIADLYVKLKEAENDPTYLQLQMEGEEIKTQLKEMNKKKDSVKSDIDQNKFKSKQLDEEIKRLENANLDIDETISELSKGNRAALSEAMEKFEGYKKTKSAGTIYNNYQPRRVTLVNQKSNAIGNLNAQQAKYRNGELGSGLEMMAAYTSEFNNLTKHDLISYEEKLRVIRENCETEFRESFLAKLRENIEKAITLFKDLNKTLKPIYYGNDSYRFGWEPDKNKKKLYEMIMSDFNLSGNNLFSTQFDEEYHDEMNELFSKLTVSDEHGDDVIHEYTDYRSYLDYDIDIVSKDGKTQKFSKIYREKSGGETQTPYYVAIAASFVQLYSIGETIRVIMLDEAFDKMDEERIESMLNFFKTQNLQIILAAPTSRLELIGEQADNIIMVYTDSDHNSLAEEFSYEEI